MRYKQINDKLRSFKFKFTAKQLNDILIEHTMITREFELVHKYMTYFGLTLFFMIPLMNIIFDVAFYTDCFGNTFLRYTLAFLTSNSYLLLFI